MSMNRRSFVQWMGASLAALGLGRQLPAQPRIPLPWIRDAQYGYEDLPKGAVILTSLMAYPSEVAGSLSILNFRGPISKGQDFLVRQGAGQWRTPKVTLRGNQSDDSFSVSLWDIAPTSPCAVYLAALSVPCPVVSRWSVNNSIFVPFPD